MTLTPLRLVSIPVLLVLLQYRIAILIAERRMPETRQQQQQSATCTDHRAPMRVKYEIN